MLNSIYEQNFLQKMPDGTVKQVNPFTGTQVWTVPGRGKRPTVNKKKNAPNPLIFQTSKIFVLSVRPIILKRRPKNRAWSKTRTARSACWKT